MKPRFEHILVTGNLGYIGSVLVPMLRRQFPAVTGYDTGYYGETCALYPDGPGPTRQIIKDIRDVVACDLESVDAIVHLAGLSNDPLGELNPKLTEAINLNATLRLAELAKRAGVRRFVYASSQSMYGISNVDTPLDEERSEKKPLTAYARTKWEAECGLQELDDESFTVVSFRPSTVFGSSPKLRCDIVYNNLIACAYTTGRLEIKSDGTPWRPVIHVQDVCAAFMAGLQAPKQLVAGQAFNVGLLEGNYTVRQLAEAVQELLPRAALVYTGEHGSDSRTYRVSFEKIFTVLKDYFHPRWDLLSGGRDLLTRFEAHGFTKEAFYGWKTNRLRRLQRLLETSRLDDGLRWRKQAAVLAQR
jgi:nucleoside-diphosphate-sugar epimerase